MSKKRYIPENTPYNYYKDGEDLDTKGNGFKKGGPTDSKYSSLINRVNTSNADFVQRINDPNRITIPAWEDPYNSVATHKLGWTTDNKGNAVVFPSVQNINGRLVDFTRPPYSKWAAYDNAVQRGDTLMMKPNEAQWYTEHYKEYAPKGNGFRFGGSLKKFEPGGPTSQDDEFQYYGTTLPTIPVYPKGTVMLNGVGYNPNGEALQQAKQLAYNNRVAQASSQRDRMSQVRKLQSDIRNTTNKVAPYVGAAIGAPLAAPAVGAVSTKALSGLLPASKYLTPGYWLGKAGHPIAGAVADAVDGTVGLGTGLYGAYENIKDNNYLKASAEGLLGLTGLSSARMLSKMASPSYRAYHAYNNISPFGYEEPLQRGKSLLNGMLQDAKYSEKSLEELSGNVPPFSPYLPGWIKNSDKIEAAARDDAFRMYLGMKPRFNMYKRNSDGTYRYNMDNIMKMSKGTWKPIPHDNLDFVTGAGGGLTRQDVIHLDNDNNVYRIEDVWDLHPFSRSDDHIAQKYTDYIATKASNLYQSMYDKLYRNKFAYNYLGGKYLNKLRFLDAPFIGLSKRDTGYGYKPSKLLSAISEKAKNFEAGPLLGGKPFKMRTDLVTHYGDLEDPFMPGNTLIEERFGPNPEYNFDFDFSNFDLLLNKMNNMNYSTGGKTDNPYIINKWGEKQSSITPSFNIGIRRTIGENKQLNNARKKALLKKNEKERREIEEYQSEGEVKYKMTNPGREISELSNELNNDGLFYKMWNRFNRNNPSMQLTKNNVYGYESQPAYFGVAPLRNKAYDLRFADIKNTESNTPFEYKITSSFNEPVRDSRFKTYVFGENDYTF